MAEDNVKHVPGLIGILRGSEQLNTESNKGSRPKRITEGLHQ
jgi:hypothetical protein